MKTEELEWRMVGLVPYNISPIQQGIQFGHGVVEYMVEHRGTPNLVKWSEEDKTFIILNGGTTNKQRKLGSGIPLGSLNKHGDELIRNGAKIAYFTEPDLGDQLTAVVFLVDERVWDREKYPNQFLSPPPSTNGMMNAVYYVPETDEAYAKRLGGEHNVWMRKFLKQFKLA
jgi:hypothetical protein